MNPKVTVGMPTYNNEKFIRNAIDSILAQTFDDFEFIISDNASTDSTPSICQEYAKSDKRIRYIRQSQNMGPIWNFNFVLQEAKGEFFMWAAADDYWLPTFLQKNVLALDNDHDIVGSISDVGLYRDFTNDLKPNIDDPTNKNSKRFQYVISTAGSYEERIGAYLRFFQGSIVYGLYRTEKMRAGFVPKHFWAIDLAIVLNILKHGNLNVTDEILMYRFVEDRPSRSIIQYQLKANIPLIKIIFLEFPFTYWCIKNLGLRVFVKYFHLFVKLNIRGEIAIISELARIAKRITFGQEKFW